MHPPKGVLFDAGGTLVQLHVDRLADELRRRGHNPHELSDAFWRTLVQLDDEFGPDAGAWGDWFPRWLARMAERCRVPGDVFREAWDGADRDALLWDHPIPGAAACLVRLREGGVRLGVVSNADGRIEGALERAGLAGYFDVIVDSTVVGVAKPDPAIFDHALVPMGLAAEDCWYLGDTVAYDVAAAEAAGLLAWVVDHQGLHTVEYDRRVGSLEEFTDLALAR